MHWVLQNNLFHEEGMTELLATLERYGIPHSEHKVVPFVGELEPDISPEGPVMVMGSYAMRHIAKKKGWRPGVFDLEDADFEVQRAHWGELMLNYDAKITTFGAVEIPPDLPLFVRPVEDSKVFAGAVFERAEFVDWQDRVGRLKEDDGSTVTNDTVVLVAPPKKIVGEWRFWIVNSRVVTWSRYKLGDRVAYEASVNGDALWLAQQIARATADWLDGWRPAPAYVLDIAWVKEPTQGSFHSMGTDVFKIVEINTINAAGLYKANMPKLVEALEDFGNRRVTK